MLLHPKQKEIVSNPARFKVIRAGRKGGKTSLEVETLCYKATASAKNLHLSKTSFPSGRKVIYIAPTQTQAREIIWGALSIRLHGIGKPNQQLLQMRVPNEDGETTTIYVGGWENRENYRGWTDVVHIGFDETDTLRHFFTAWVEIFRPMFLDTGGSADFFGTPKKENQNLRRLEKEFEKRSDAASFKFTSHDNPHLSRDELAALEEDYENDRNSYRQEILAEYVDNAGALFKYNALIDLFTNTITKTSERYLIVDIADDGSDKTIFSFWEGLEMYRLDMYEQLQTDGIISQIRESAAQERIPYTQIAVDAIGVGAGVASSPLLAGVVGFKSSYAAIRTDRDIVRLPNVHYLKDPPLVSEYRNLRAQCIFTLARQVNEHKMAVKVEDARVRSNIIEELSNYQDISAGDGKGMATMKEDVKAIIGRSPDISDTLIMRMYFLLREKMAPFQSEDQARVRDIMSAQFDRNRRALETRSTK